jgi:hypothetical protein
MRRGPFGYASAEGSNATSRICSEEFVNLRITTVQSSAARSPVAKQRCEIACKVFCAHTESLDETTGAITPLCLATAFPEQQDTAKLHGLARRLGFFLPRSPDDTLYDSFW